MTPAPSSPLLERTLFALLALAAIHLPMVPVSHSADRVVLPDLLYALTLAWVVRRPATAPLGLVLAVGLAGDILLARPPGLGALGLVLASEAVRARRGWLANAFPAEWVVASFAFGVVTAATAALLALTLAPLPDPRHLAAHWVVTVLAYPVVAGALAAAGRLRQREPA
jgi:rod shape-determining protein MreD